MAASGQQQCAPYSRFGAAVTALAAVVLLSLITSPVRADCECGYSTTIDSRPYVFTDLIETDFAKVADISANTDWVRQEFNISNAKARGRFGEMFAVQNIFTDPNGDGNGDERSRTSNAEPAGLQLVVRAERVDEMVPVAEIDTARLDVVFGSYRAGLKLTNVPGTCSAFFWYFNDTQEIDMEFLSKDFDPANNRYPVNLVLQSREAVEQGFDAARTHNLVKANLPFNPTDGIHEYRIDYLPGRVRFYADDKLLGEMGGPAVPDHSGHLVLQHWSNGNPLWSGGPPARDAATTVAYVKAYFNSSEAQRLNDWERRCPDAAAPRAVCRIPDGSPRGPDTNTPPAGWFFSYQTNMTNNQTVSSTNGNAGPGAGPGPGTGTGTAIGTGPRTSDTGDPNEAPHKLQEVWWSLVPTLLVAVGWCLDVW